jgi:hypothetical protein
MVGPDEALRAAIEDSKVVDKGMAGDRAYCTNPRCLKPWKKGDVKNPLKACKGCKIAMYCSVRIFFSAAYCRSHAYFFLA